MQVYIPPQIGALSQRQRDAIYERERLAMWARKRTQAAEDASRGVR